MNKPQTIFTFPSLGVREDFLSWLADGAGEQQFVAYLAELGVPLVSFDWDNGDEQIDVEFDDE